MFDIISAYELEMALQERCCPPLAVLQSGSPLARKHLAACSRCKQALELGTNENCESMMENEDVGTPRAGDIRRIELPVKAENYFDQDGVYYNPPYVLVLESADKTGLVRVAQLFEHSALASQGDVHLSKGDFYAQAWNVYGMHIDHLGPAMGNVGEPVAESILRMSDEQFEPVAVNGPLWRFRQNEIACGCFFAMPSVSYALNMLETAPAKNIPDYTEFFQVEYAAAAAGGYDEYQDDLRQAVVTIHGSEARFKSRSSASFYFQLLDEAGRPVLLNGPSVVNISEDVGEGMSSDNKGFGTVVIVGPYETVVVNIDHYDSPIKKVVMWQSS